MGGEEAVSRNEKGRKRGSSANNDRVRREEK